MCFLPQKITLFNLGIEWKQIDYFNNKTICDLIEKKPICIINIMDEECHIFFLMEKRGVEKEERNVG